MPSIYLDWVQNLSDKAQSTLASANRGPDGETREDVMKTLVRGIRKMTQVPAHGKAGQPGGYKYFEMEQLRPALDAGVPDIAKYPFHFLQHLYEALEVIAYQHPIEAVRAEFFYAYRKIVSEMHLEPESEQQYLDRMEHRAKNKPLEPKGSTIL